MKRHSKANANHLLKSQKQYFAKARQRLQNGSAPAAPSTFSIFDGQFTADRLSDLHRPTTRPKQLVKSSESAHHLNPSPNGPEAPIDSRTSGKDDARVHRSATRHTPTPLQVQNQPKRPKPLDHIKRRLLQNSDWTGLALARPVSMNFMPAEEMERIGRRRKVTKEERRRKDQAFGQQKVHHNLIRPFDDRRSQSTPQVPEAADLSIRIGSNIHQTLTTQPSLQEIPVSSSNQPATEDSMLLDKFEHRQRNTPPKDQEAPYLAAAPEGVHTSTRSDLMPLNEARALQSFDEVLQRSSSIVRQVQPSSTPFGDGLPYHRTPVRASQGETSPASSFGTILHSGHILLDLEQSRNHSPDTHNNHNAGGKKQAQLSNTKSGEFGLPGRGAGQHKFGRSAATTQREEELSTSKSEYWPRTFTLDHQVASERESSERVHSYLRDDMVSVSAAAKLQPLQHSPLSNLQVVTRSPLLPDPSSAHRGGLTRRFPSLPASSVSSAGFNAPLSPAQHSAQPSTRRSQALLQPVHASPRSTASHSEAEVRPMVAKSWMERFRLAKRQHQASRSDNNVYVEKPESQTGGLGDENEAWMRFVFPKDFSRIQAEFIFGMAHLGEERSKASSFSTWDYATQPLSVSGHVTVETSSALAAPSAHLSSRLAPSAANATIFEPRWNHQVANDGFPVQSETDFLSRYSPMEGVLDEGLGHISIYNNAAATDRSFLSLPP